VTQESQTAFISANFDMSVIQIVADSSLVLSVPASASSASIVCRIERVCSPNVAPCPT